MSLRKMEEEKVDEKRSIGQHLDQSSSSEGEESGDEEKEMLPHNVENDGHIPTSISEPENSDTDTNIFPMSLRNMEEEKVQEKRSNGQHSDQSLSSEDKVLGDEEKFSMSLREMEEEKVEENRSNGQQSDQSSSSEGEESGDEEKEMLPHNVENDRQIDTSSREPENSDTDTNIELRDIFPITGRTGCDDKTRSNRYKKCFSAPSNQMSLRVRGLQRPEQMNDSSFCSGDESHNNELQDIFPITGWTGCNDKTRSNRYKKYFSAPSNQERMRVRGLQRPEQMNDISSCSGTGSNNNGLLKYFTTPGRTGCDDITMNTRYRQYFSAPSNQMSLRVRGLQRPEQMNDISFCSGDEFHNNEREEDVSPSNIINELFTDSSEETVLRTFHQLIHMGEDLNKQEKDNNGQSILHKAVRKNFLSVVEKFLDYGFKPLSYDRNGEIALHIAIREGYDEMAALIVSKLDNFVVRRLFGDSQAIYNGSESNEQRSNENDNSDVGTNSNYGIYDDNTVEPMFTINELIKRDLDKTLRQVFDSLMDEQRDGQYTVHVKLLDTDNQGREPTREDFDFKCHTAFHDLAKREKKDALNHPAIRTFVEYKWKKWCQRHFLFYFFKYLFGLFCWTYSAVIGVNAPDVHIYDTELQHSRAVFEAIAYLFALVTLFTEVLQIVRHKKYYFTHGFNVIKLISSIFLVVVLPLRYINEKVHWYVFAVGYCFWAMRVFKYSQVFITTGIYAEVIKRIIIQDVVQFSILFVTVNLIFSGTFLLILKADSGLDTHDETSSFLGIMFVGLRTLIEAGAIVEYTGPGRYRVTGTLCMMIFVFLTIVVLRNILIAQVSKTYTRTHDDCLKTVRANRAWTVVRAERTEWHILPLQSNRVKYYEPFIENVDLKAIERKEASTIDVIFDKMCEIQNKQIKDGLEVQTVKTRLRHLTQRLEGRVKKDIETTRDNKSTARDRTLARAGTQRPETGLLPQQRNFHDTTEIESTYL